MKRPFRACLLVITAWYASVSSCEADECLAQAWQGTVGDTKIMMEFEYADGDDVLSGWYYYRNSMVGLIIKGGSFG